MLGLTIAAVIASAVVCGAGRPAWARETTPAGRDTPPPEELVSDAEDDHRHRAFGRLTCRSLPAVGHADRVRTGVDAFVLARLEMHGLGFSAPADRRTLIRRVCFDLLGLPPSPRQVEAFLADRSPDAYERLLDGTLSSPHFGERWGRHWLDAAGYVDVYGSDENAPSIRLPPGGWRYRDYVVQSLNQDRPHDRFLLEQIAGDELVDWRRAGSFTPKIVDLLVATGFLRTAIDDTDQDVLNIPSNRYATLFDQMQIFGSCVLGLTLQCARCHSHKYEPIPQRDFYRLMANFTPAYNPHAWVKLDARTLPDVGARRRAAIEKHNAECDRQVKELTARLKALEEAVKGGRPDGDERRTMESLRAQIAAVKAGRQGWGSIQALYDTGPPPETRVLRRGEFDNPGPPVHPGFLKILSTSDSAALTRPSSPAGETSGRRLALARWLTAPDTPASALAARVIVNRVWHHLLGRGIVATVGNLGRSGDAPTHPDLLDWLAGEFVDGGWRIKPLIKLVMTSAVYRQTSSRIAAESRVDPQNHLLWRMRLRRLDAEAIRDAMLAIGDALDRTFGGPPVPLENLPGGRIVVKTKGLPTPTSQWRRSVYLTSRRNYNISMLSVFDMPVITTNCTARTSSAIVLQSLTMMNDDFVLRQAEFIARRAEPKVGASPQERVRRAFQLVLTREPTAKEIAWSTELLADQAVSYRAAKLSAAESDRKATASLCQMLLSSNNFLYVE